MSLTARPNASSSRDDKRTELRERMDKAMLLYAAYTALADEIDVLTAGRQSFVAIWAEVSQKLRKDATHAQNEHDKAFGRLSDLNSADAARDRWIPRRSDDD